MEGAIESCIVEKAAGGNHLGLERIFRFTGHLAEIRRKSRSHQRLQPCITPRAEDLDLKISAARRAARMVCRGTRSDRAGIHAVQSVLEDRESSGGEPQVDRLQPVCLDYEESVPLQAPGLLGATGRRGRGAGKPVGGAVRLRGPGGRLEMAASDVEDGVHKEFEATTPEVSKSDAVGMPQQPRSFMIGRVGALLEGPNSERDRYLLTMGAQVAAGRGCRHSVNLIRALPPLPLSRSWLYVCEPFQDRKSVV